MHYSKSVATLQPFFFKYLDFVLKYACFGANLPIFFINYSLFSKYYQEKNLHLSSIYAKISAKQAKEAALWKNEVP